MKISKNILLAPLDWGLGHVTRCIIFYEWMQSQGWTVYWGLSNDAAIQLVYSYFPEAKVLEIPSYQITYSEKENQFFLNLFLQSPKILNAIKNEHQWLQTQHQRLQFDLIISDNRYGMYHPIVPSVFIGHQIYLRSGKRDWMDNMASKMQKKYLQRFTEVWKLDDEDLKLSGDLAWKEKDDFPSIGISSQFMCQQFQEEHLEKSKSLKKTILFLLSGPEPQRTLLEKNIRKQISNLKDYNLILIRGTLDVYSDETDSYFDKIIDLAKGQELFDELLLADVVVCRSGYSTLMDAMYLGKRMLLIPTPGQTEQEYLATYFQKGGWAITEEQDDLNLKHQLEEAIELKPIQLNIESSKRQFLSLVKDKLGIL